MAVQTLTCRHVHIDPQRCTSCEYIWCSANSFIFTFDLSSNGCVLIDASNICTYIENRSKLAVECSRTTIDKWRVTYEFRRHLSHRHPKWRARMTIAQHEHHGRPSRRNSAWPWSRDHFSLRFRVRHGMCIRWSSVARSSPAILY